jgi:protein-disulfide isomerase
MAILRVPLSARDHVIGGENAEVTVVEYGDYECPHCAAAHVVVHRIVQQFGDRLLFAFRHFPLTEIHPHAGPAAEAAEFADAHGRFWDMHNAIYANQPRLSVPLLFMLASALKLSQSELQDALATHRYAQRVQSDFLGGVRSGVNGTPTFFINGQRHDGAYAFPDLVSAIARSMTAAQPHA